MPKIAGFTLKSSGARVGPDLAGIAKIAALLIATLIVKSIGRPVVGSTATIGELSRVLSKVFALDPTHRTLRVLGTQQTTPRQPMSRGLTAGAADCSSAPSKTRPGRLTMFVRMLERGALHIGRRAGPIARVSVRFEHVG